MKNKILALIGVAALGLATVTQLHAQTPTYNSTLVMNAVVFPAGLSNLATPYIIDVRRSGTVTLENTVSVTGSGVTNCSLYFAPSVSGTYYNTNQMVIFTFNTSGSPVGGLTTTTNITCGAPAYWKLVAVSNGYAGQTITNTLYVGQKISSP
jgi:hypothetical protein